MTERAGRHAAARDRDETLTLPARSWPVDDGASPPEPAGPTAGRHVNGDGRASAPAPNPAASVDATSATARAQPARQERSGAAGSASKLRLVWVYPDLLSTYGDRGNLLVLSRRARLRGIEVEPNEVNSDQRVPAQGDIYLLGGGEDLPQILAARRLSNDGGLAAAIDRGAVVFAVCAGYQVIGHQFGGVEGEPVSGLGLLDITSGRGVRRGVGELVADAAAALGVPRLSGFENHQGVTSIGPGTEGAFAGKVVGTYMHGPALARNPGLADLLLSWAVGPLPPLDPAAEEWAGRLRAERLGSISPQ
jgi:lipid II isoglutaminyl synthase (glutamine-hydrolysing)